MSLGATCPESGTRDAQPREPHAPESHTAMPALDHPFTASQIGPWRGLRAFVETARICVGMKIALESVGTSVRRGVNHHLTSLSSQQPFSCPIFVV